jgi:uncharacterized protein (UPF0335 family)
MPSVEDIQATKQAIERLGREVGEIEGRQKQWVERLAELGFKTLKEAEAALPKLKKELKTLTEKRDALLNTFWKEYGAKLNSDTIIVDEPPY